MAADGTTRIFGNILFGYLRFRGLRDVVRRRIFSPAVVPGSGVYGHDIIPALARTEYRRGIRMLVDSRAFLIKKISLASSKCYVLVIPA